MKNKPSCGTCIIHNLHIAGVPGTQSTATGQQSQTTTKVSSALDDIDLLGQSLMHQNLPVKPVL